MHQRVCYSNVIDDSHRTFENCMSGHFIFQLKNKKKKVRKNKSEQLKQNQMAMLWMNLLCTAVCWSYYRLPLFCLR